MLVYDSRNLEEWFQIAPVPSRWFSSYVNKYPADGIVTIEEFWKEWSQGPNGTLPTKAVTTGREYESKQLFEFLQGAPGIKAIQASSKDEAVAFIIASAMEFEGVPREIFVSKSLVIETPANFRSVRINQFGLNLIAKFDDPQILYAGVSDGHHVLVPLGADDAFNQEIMNLPLIDRDGLVEVLESMGLSKTVSLKYSRESARNVIVLKRLLKFPQKQLKWSTPDSASDIIPAMLIGRWDENKNGDIELIEKLTDEDYKSYIKKIEQWNNYEAPPFLKIGGTWRLTSPLEAWSNLAPYIKLEHLEGLKDCFMEGYRYGNPTLDSESDSFLFSSLSKEKKYSNWIREGLIQSLILFGLYGKGLRIPEVGSPQEWVDEILHELLDKADGEMWISLDTEMPLVAEASPTSFFNALFNSLSRTPPPIMESFVEEEGLLSPTSHHTGLLWALEGLAWEPEYLFNSALALSKLAHLDPGGRISNRPINSLVEIFKPWHFQTLASFNERMEVVGEITNTVKDVGWTLLLRMLPQPHGVAHPTHKMRWKMFDHSFEERYTRQETWNTHSHVISVLISLFDYSEKQLTDVLNNVDSLSSKDRDTLLSFLNLVLSRIHQSEYTGWHTLRNKLSHHRSHQDTEWALPDGELRKLQSLYERLEPKDTELKYKWLFDEHWPTFPEGYTTETTSGESLHEQQQKKIIERRIQGLEKILDQFGIEGAIELNTRVKESWALGDTLAQIVDDEQTTISVAKLLSASNENTILFAQSFIYRKSVLNGEEWVFKFYNEFSKRQVDASTLAGLFIPLDQTLQLWDFLNQISKEIKTEYWLKMRPRFYSLEQDDKIYGIGELISHSRLISAIDISCHKVEEIPSELIVEILEKAATIDSQESARLHGYEIENYLRQSKNVEML